MRTSCVGSSNHNRFSAPDSDFRHHRERDLPEDARFPTVDRLKKAHGTAAMPGPQAAANLVIKAMEKLREPKAGFKNGEFHDIRNLD